MEVIIEIKEVYGNTLYYPLCDNGKTFAEIAGKKTLTKEIISMIKTLGYAIQIKQKALEI
jgi:Flp pilus assembly CpaE family ATPase